jgi:hypothetical protein
MEALNNNQLSSGDHIASKVFNGNSGVIVFVDMAENKVANLCIGWQFEKEKK